MCVCVGGGVSAVVCLFVDSLVRGLLGCTFGWFFGGFFLLVLEFLEFRRGMAGQGDGDCGLNHIHTAQRPPATRNAERTEAST